MALIDILDENTPYNRLIIARSAVATRDMGALPGDKELKQAEYETPYISFCHELTGRKDAYEKLKENGTIEFVTTSYLRGLTFNNSIILFDEFQSATWHEISTVMTRYGRDSKLIICGDSAQNDLIVKKNDVSGFREFLEVSKTMSEFRHFKFTPSDIVR